MKSLKSSIFVFVLLAVSYSTVNGQIQKSLSDNIGKSSAEIISNQTPRFRVIKSLLSDYMNKTLDIYGYCSLGDYYNGKYIRGNYYCIEIEDSNREKLYVYFPKSIGRGGDMGIYIRELVDLLSESDRVPMMLSIECRYDMYIKEAGAQFDGYAWMSLK